MLRNEYNEEGTKELAEHEERRSYVTVKNIYVFRAEREDLRMYHLYSNETFMTLVITYQYE